MSAERHDYTPHVDETEEHFEGRGRPVLLALSTFRHSEAAIEFATEKAAEGRDLVLAYIADVNLARYYLGSDVGLYPELRENTRRELLHQHRHEADEKAAEIAQRLRGRGVTVRVYVNVGRFAAECLKLVEKEHPELIVTTRSERPRWVKKFFGSPVDKLREKTGCPVIER